MTTIRVLVADDNSAIRETTAQILVAEGYAVTGVEDGDAALEVLTTVPTQVALLDVRMPRRDGISVVEGLNPAPPPPVVVFLSAFAFDSETRGRLGARVFRYLRKPVPPQELIDVVREAVEASASSSG